MPKTRTIEVTAHSPASPHAVWELLADGGSWASWGPWEETTVESGDGAVGTVKTMRRGRYTLREEITVFDAPRRLGYRVLSGMPVRDYEATVTLTSEGTGTRIDWRARFAPKHAVLAVPLARGLRKLLDEVVTAAARAARG